MLSQLARMRHPACRIAGDPAHVEIDQARTAIVHEWRHRVELVEKIFPRGVRRFGNETILRNRDADQHA